MAIHTGVPAVSKSSSGRLSKREQAELDDALAALIASTRCVARKLNLLEIGEKLAIARRYLGGLEAVASAVGLSSEMLRQFSRVAALSPPVRRLIAEGKLTSVDIADRISRLAKKDQAFVAKRVADGELDSGDVRAVIAHRKLLPRLPMEQVVRRVMRSKNVPEYVVEFLVPEGLTPRAALSRLIAFFGPHTIRDSNIGDSAGQVCITRKGKELLRQMAKSKGLSKRELLGGILSGEVTGE